MSIAAQPPQTDGATALERNGRPEAAAITRDLTAIEAILNKHNRRRTALIPVLQEIQNSYRYLPEDLLVYVASALSLSSATVYGVATFYAQFSLEPKGKYVVRVCDGTACHVKNSPAVLNAIRKRVKLTNGTATTPDGLFTVETVACLGACGLAPVMVINDQVHGQLTAEAAETIIDELLARESAQEVAA